MWELSCTVGRSPARPAALLASSAPTAAPAGRACSAPSSTPRASSQNARQTPLQGAAGWPRPQASPRPFPARACGSPSPSPPIICRALTQGSPSSSSGSSSSPSSSAAWYDTGPLSTTTAVGLAGSAPRAGGRGGRACERGGQAVGHAAGRDPEPAPAAPLGSLGSLPPCFSIPSPGPHKDPDKEGKPLSLGLGGPGPKTRLPSKKGLQHDWAGQGSGLTSQRLSRWTREVACRLARGRLKGHSSTQAHPVWGALGPPSP